MKVYITKYALTDGIFENEVEVCEDIDPNMVRVLKDKNGKLPFGNVTYHKGDWWKTKEAAIHRAEEMRRKKIASIEKQLKRIKALNFNP